MKTSKMDRFRTRSRYLDSLRPALARIEDHLERTQPDLEAEKIKKVITILFGERPSNTTFSHLRTADVAEKGDRS